MNLRLVKLGGSLITDKRRPRTVRRGDLARISAEIAAAMQRTRTRVLLGHGSGSFGHVAAAAHRIDQGVRGPRGRAGVAATQAAAIDLHRIVVGSLTAQGLAPVSWSPSSAMVATNGRPSAMTIAPVEYALEAALLPVTHGDIVFDRALGASIVSTETVLVALARRLLRRGAVIREACWFGDTDGIYDETGVVVPRVTVSDAASLLRSVGGSAATDVTGGMRHRLEMTLALARLGVPSLIANGRVAGIVAASLRGERVPGTRIEV